MDTNTVKYGRLYSLIVLYDMHTKFFSNVLEGISEEDAHNRLHTKANHTAWLAGSLVHERYELANALGVEERSYTHGQTCGKLFEGHKSIQDNVIYPPLNAYKKDWQNVAPVLRNAMVNLADEQLDSADPFDMPGDEFTLFDAISFLIYREAYCIGQIGLWRRLLGYDAMKYS